MARLKLKHEEVRSHVLQLQMQITDIDSQITPGQATSFTDRFGTCDSTVTRCCICLLRMSDLK